jgi:uncharacterized protein YjbJ (UPF0337 family)
MQESSTRERHFPKGAASSAPRHGAASSHETDRTRGRLDARKGMEMIGGEIEQIKQRLKKAAGVVEDDDSHTNDGKLDQVVEKVKIKVERVKGKLQQAVDQMKAAVAAKRGSRWVK